MEFAHLGYGPILASLLAVLGWTYSRVLDDIRDWKAHTDDTLTKLGERVACIEGELKRIP